MANRQLGRDLKAKAQKLSKYFRKKYKGMMSDFLSDLSDGIISHSPVSWNAPYARNYFVNHTVIYPDNEEHTVNYEYNPHGYHPIPVVINGLGTTQMRMTGRVDRFPHTLTVENITKSPGGVEYSENVERTGWKRTKPYKPLLKGYQYAVRRNPEIAKWMKVSYGDSVINQGKKIALNDAITVSVML